MRASGNSRGTRAAIALALVLMPACARDHAQPMTTLTAVANPGRIGAVDSRALGASVREPITILPERISWGDAPPMLLPGARMAILEGDPTTPSTLFTLRLTLPPNYRIMPHWHPTDEHVTVLAGSLFVGHGDDFARDPRTVLSAGGFAVLPADHHHFAGTGSTEAIIQIHAVGPFEFNYVDPGDDPRRQKR